MGLLSHEIIKLIVIATPIAWLAAWYFMNGWLQNFAYRTRLSWELFALAGLLSVIVALATVSGQTLKAARRNPVQALRYE
jgi:putative ABC transport system permease protein